MAEQVIPRYASTHATTIYRALLVCLVRLAVIIVIIAHRVLLGLLLLLVVDLLLEGSCLSLSVSNFLLLLAFELLSTFGLNLLLGILI